MAAAPDVSAPPWRREPHRLLFPLGAGLALAAVLPFAARGAAAGGSLALFHSVAQIEGFLTCFVAGFLFTFVPRRTGTPGPETWQLFAATALPIAAVATAWADEPVVAHGLWLLLVLVVLGFTVGRWRTALPPAFIWVPLALGAGAAGAALTAGAPLLGGAPAWTIGRGLLTQGLVAGLVLGTAGALHGAPRPAAGRRPARRAALALHAALALAFFGSFALPFGLPARGGAGLRAAIACAVLLAAHVARPPAAGALHRRLAWAGTWLVPAGFALEALAPPRLRGAALHVLFVGGFAQLTLALALEVVFADGQGAAARARWPLRTMALFLAAAFGARIAAGLDVHRVAAWLAVAALAFAGALAAWARILAAALRGDLRRAPTLHLREEGR
ncbi:MAG: NnrS family protein [Anaeromyxobacteraceae bacterium]